MDDVDLPEQMILRRQQLGLSGRRAANEAGVRRETWGDWERGVVPRADHRGGIERAMRWQPGSVDAALAGDWATPVDPTPPRSYVDPLTGQEYMDPDERELWDLRHQLGLRYVDTLGERVAAARGADRSRELIAYLRSRTEMDPPRSPVPVEDTDANPAQVA